MQLISDQLYEQVIKDCTSSKFDAAVCNDLENRASAEKGNIDRHSIYAPICIDNSSQMARVSVCLYESKKM